MSASFTLSHFLRHAGEVLSALDRGDVVLHRRDADDLLLTRAADAEAIRTVLGMLAAVADELGATPEGRTVVDAAARERITWTRQLTGEERRQLVADLARAAATAVELNDPAGLRAALERWQAVAKLRASGRPRGVGHAPGLDPR